MQVEWSLIHDFVIVRSDGAPIFFLANAVDDLDMGITHVIRGEDLIDSTHRVLALRHARSARPTRREYAHLPLIVDAESRAKLSKRHGAVALEDFVAAGYLPEALVNYLALLGWAPADDGHEVLDAAELIAQFDLDRVTHAAAGFDRDKLDWLNGEWIRRLDLDELVGRVLTARAGAVRRRRRSRDGRARPRWHRAGAGGHARADRRPDGVPLRRPTPTSRSSPSRGRRSRAPIASREVLDAVDRARRGVRVDRRRARRLQPVHRGARHQVPEGGARACYAAVEGVHRGLPLFDSMFLLGRERTLARLRAARDRLRDGSLGVSRGTGPLIWRDLRGWCNRQHSRFWSCLWGFESSPPSS